MRTRWKSFCGHKPRRAWRNFSGLMHRLWIGLGARLPSAGCCTRAGPSTFSMALSWKSGATRLKGHRSTMMGIWRSLGRCFGRGLSYWINSWTGPRSRASICRAFWPSTRTGGRARRVICIWTAVAVQPTTSMLQMRPALVLGAHRITS